MMGEDADDFEEQLLQLVEENKEADTKDIMQQLLDSESSLTSRKMAEWLMKPGIVDLLIKFVTRNVSGQPGEPDLKESLYLDSCEYFYSSERRREALLERIPPKDGESDSEDDGGLQFTVEAKRADKAAEVLASHIVGFNIDFIEANLPTIVKRLFDIFEIKAEGDFDNFCKIFENLLTKFSGRVVSLFSQPSSDTPALILHFLNYLHDPSISESLILILKPMLPEQFVVNFYNNLNSIGFWQFLGQKIYDLRLGRNSCEEAADFFLKLLDSVGSSSHADVFFSQLGRDNTFVNGLVDAIISKDFSKEQQIACIHSLRALLLKSGEQLYDQSLELYTQTPLPNMLKGIRASIHHLLITKSADLSTKILREVELRDSSHNTSVEVNSLNQGERRYSTYSVKHPISMSMMSLLDIILELTEESPERVFNSWNKQIWRVFVNWCFENCWNNIYHSFFWKMFLNVFKIGHEESMKLMLSKYKLLSKLIDHYSTTRQFTSGFRGYSIKIANYLRLFADSSPPGSFIRQFLASHESWKQFLPILREDTIFLLVTDYPPPLHINLINPFLQHDFSSMTNQKPMKPITRDDAKIDLGSKYADQLGFAGKQPTPVSDSQNKKKRRNRKGKGRGNNNSNNNNNNNNNNSVQMNGVGGGRGRGRGRGRGGQMNGK